MARPVRLEYPGAVYHVICRGNNRQTVFCDDHDRKRYLGRLSYYCDQKGVELLAYCLLTNHVHLLLETPTGNLSKMMQPFQTSYTVYFNKRHKRSGHVFEQRYKAFVVDKDNYLLEVSRYIHLNPVSAGIVKEPRKYRWSSYGLYCNVRARGAVNCQRLLEYFSGSRRGQLAGYRESVERKLAEGKMEALPVLKQAFIGDEEFAEEARKKATKLPASERVYPLKRIVQVVGEVSGERAEEIRRPGRSPAVKSAREIICYLARRHSDVGLRELTRFLGVKELSTPSHGVRRAEQRLNKEPDFRLQLEQVLKILSHSSMQA
jgi:putative transposase